MRSRRRPLLKVASAIGLGGAGVAYWQWRPIRRWDDIDAIETALAIPVPTIPNPVTVTADLLEASYSRAREHVETTEQVLPDPDAQESGHLENANKSLADHPPTRSTMTTSDTKRSITTCSRSRQVQRPAVGT